MIYATELIQTDFKEKNENMSQATFECKLLDDIFDDSDTYYVGLKQ